MALLFHWVGQNYRTDREEGFGYNLNQNGPLILKAKPNDTIWAFTRRKDGVYVLAARGTIEKVSYNKPGFHYGAYRIWLNPEDTVYFDVEKGLDAEPLIRSLSIKTRGKILGWSFQGPAGVREISEADDMKLREFAKVAE